ncbi:MAG: acyltransferase family protein [Janthinobacterium lividum]
MTGFFSKRIQPPLLKHTYGSHIEQYRGLCALLVLITHGTAHENLLINNFRWPEFLHYIGAGYLSVLVFFCISGYVIGISNDHIQLKIKPYLKKRFIRLYPAYLIAVLLCVIIANDVNIFVLAGNLIFLQNASPYWHYQIPVFVNFATWSLNYEVLYYALFIPLFFIRPKVWQLLLIMFLFSIILINTTPNFVFIIQYLNGYYFWILGLFFGWKIFNANKVIANQIPLLSMLFMQLCQQHLGIGVIVLHLLKLDSNTNFNWLFDIPFCLMIMGILTNTNNAFFKINKIFCYIIPSVVFLYLILQHRIFENERWTMCLIFWIGALLFYNEKKISALILHQLTTVGKISYSLYLLHVPIALLIKKIVFISNPTMEITVKYVLWVAVTFSLAFLLDEIFQPAIKKYFSNQLG